MTLGTAAASVAGATKGWSRKFDDPIALPNGKLVTLKDAVEHLSKTILSFQSKPQPERVMTW